MAKNEEVVNDTVIDETAQHAAPEHKESESKTSEFVDNMKAKVKEVKQSVEERLEAIEAHLKQAFNNFGR